MPSEDIVNMTVNVPFVNTAKIAVGCEYLIEMLKKAEKVSPELRDQAYESYVDAGLLENGWKMVGILKDTIDHYQSLIEELESRLPTMSEGK